jgi:hypothetical protein
MPQTSRGRVQDRKRLATGQPHEMQYEAKSRRTTDAAVATAAKRAGVSRAAVDAELRRSRRQGRSIDRQRISLNQPHELRYWSSKFGVKPAQLRAAVKLVGPMAKYVQDFLLQRRLSGARVLPSLFGTVITDASETRAR